MKVHEIKRIISQIPAERDGEDIAMYHPFYRRLFKIEAVDDANVIDSDLPEQLVFVTSDVPYGR